MWRGKHNFKCRGEMVPGKIQGKRRIQISTLSVFLYRMNSPEGVREPELHKIATKSDQGHFGTERAYVTCSRVPG